MGITLAEICSGQIDLANQMRDYYVSLKAEKKKGIHPSSLAILCPREYYFYLSEEARPPEQDVFFKILLEDSTWEHLRIQEVWRRMGILWGRWLCHKCEQTFEDLSPKVCPKCGGKFLDYREVPMRKKEWNMSGRGDGILVIGNDWFLGEIKSTNAFDFPKIVSPRPEHVFQINCYLAMFSKKALCGCWLVYVNRNDGGFKAFWVEQSAEVLEKIGFRVKEIQEALRTGRPPEYKFRSGNYYCLRKCGTRNLCQVRG